MWTQGLFQLLNWAIQPLSHIGKNKTILNLLIIIINKSMPRTGVCGSHACPAAAAAALLGALLLPLCCPAHHRRCPTRHCRAPPATATAPPATVAAALPAHHHRLAPPATTVLPALPHARSRSATALPYTRCCSRCTNPCAPPPPPRCPARLRSPSSPQAVTAQPSRNAATALLPRVPFRRRCAAPHRLTHMGVGATALPRTARAPSSPHAPSRCPHARCRCCTVPHALLPPPCCPAYHAAVSGLLRMPTTAALPRVAPRSPRPHAPSPIAAVLVQ